MQSNLAPPQMSSLPVEMLHQMKLEQAQMGMQDTGNNGASHPEARKMQNMGPVPGSGEQLPNGVATAHKHQIPFNGLSFHNPFDPNSYPLTNPPLYDPTMLPLGPQGGVRRRRISISNGQIGQIVNHEAFYVDDDSMDDYYDGSGYRQYAHGHHPHHMPDMSGQQRQTVPDHVPALNNNLPLLQPAVSGHVPLAEAPSAVSSSSQAVSVSGSPSMAGLPPPNQTLVYNNEVIFNPHDGPIPGTAAWKKDRLLERNRLAASKCRQRKKNAQQQLQNNMAKFEKELQAKDEQLKKAEKVLAMYNSALESHFSGNPSALESLRPFISQPIENIKLDS